MKLNILSLDKRQKKTNALKLITLLFFFFSLEKILTLQSKSSKAISLIGESFLEKTANKGSIKVEDQPLTINLFNNLTFFVGRAEGLVDLKTNQQTVKNKNYYSAVLNFKMNKTDIQNIQDLQLKNQTIKDQRLIELSDFLDYFPNMGRMITENEMSIDLRYLWKCRYQLNNTGNYNYIDTDFITKESSTQHGFKVQFRITDKNIQVPAIREFFDNVVKNCKSTQKSLVALKSTLHKLIVKYLNIKTLMRILRETKDQVQSKTPYIPNKPTVRKFRKNKENNEKNKNLNSNHEVIKDIEPDGHGEDVKGPTLTEVDDDSEAMRLFFIEKGKEALSTNENEEELYEATFLENSKKENKFDTSNNANANVNANANANANAHNSNVVDKNEKKGFFDKSKSFFGNLIDQGKNLVNSIVNPKDVSLPTIPTVPLPTTTSSANNDQKNIHLKKKKKSKKQKKRIIIQKPDLNIPLNKTDITDPITKLELEKQEEDIKNLENQIKEQLTKKQFLDKQLIELETRRATENLNKDVLKNSLSIANENTSKSLKVIEMLSNEVQNLEKTVGELNEKKIQ
jgi:hypothetical protein